MIKLRAAVGPLSLGGGYFGAKRFLLLFPALLPFPLLLRFVILSVPACRPNPRFSIKKRRMIFYIWVIMNITTRKLWGLWSLLGGPGWCAGSCDITFLGEGIFAKKWYVARVLYFPTPLPFPTQNSSSFSALTSSELVQLINLLLSASWCFFSLARGEFLKLQLFLRRGFWNGAFEGEPPKRLELLWTSTALLARKVFDGCRATSLVFGATFRQGFENWSSGGEFLAALIARATRPKEGILCRYFEQENWKNAPTQQMNW